jgi:hypothetical protein
MTIKQKQWQLYLLGYLSRQEDIDGIWGMKSRMATLEFQMDHFPDSIAHDGIFGPSTEVKSREIIDNIQDVVTAYVGTPLVNDGLAGWRTLEAVGMYQEAMGLPKTGIVDKATYGEICQWVGPVPDAADNHVGDKDSPTGTFLDEIEFFTEKEFACKCGGRYCNGYPARMREEVVRICDAARRHFGRPGHIISGLRCQIHNANEGGVANSQHMYGEACDLQIQGVSSDQLLAFILAQPGVRYAYKINGTNVHFDIPKGNR